MVFRFRYGTDHEIKMRKVMDIGQSVVDSNNKAVRKLHATSLRLSKSEMLLQTTQLSLIHISEPTRPY